MKKFLLAIFTIFILISIAPAIEHKPLTQKFLLYQSVEYGQPAIFNGRLFIVTGGRNRGLKAIQIKLK